MAPTTNAQRAALFSLASLHVALCSGTAYGWTALRPVLLDAGLFAGATEIGRARAMSWISTLGIAANALCKMPLGFVLDHAGPRSTAVLGGVMVLAGSALMALGDRESLPQMAAGYFLLGVAGPFVQMPTFQFTELYGAAGKGTAMSQLVTCFELSTGVFELMSVAYFSGSKEIFNLRAMFLAYSACGLFVAITAVLFWPDRPHRAPQVGGSGGAAPPAAPLAHLGIRAQLRSGAFWMAASFMCVHIFRQGFVLATLGPQMEAFFPAKTAKTLSEAFSTVLPMGFIPMAILTAVGAAGAILKRPMFAFFFRHQPLHGVRRTAPRAQHLRVLRAVRDIPAGQAAGVQHLLQLLRLRVWLRRFRQDQRRRVHVGRCDSTLDVAVHRRRGGGRSVAVPGDHGPRVALARGGRVPRVRPRVFARRARVLRVQKRPVARRRLRRG
mmetsp:Transcript_11767/g.49445  ORF Transcript_11767/g.49445 Transcript_11767/m.49445 type:complete len:440 (-) Transcript_11767:760-2079(-)